MQIITVLEIPGTKTSDRWKIGRTQKAEMQPENKTEKKVEAAIAILKNCNSIFKPFLDPFFGPNDCLTHSMQYSNLPL